MGLFNKILEKIGIGKKDETAGATVATPAAPVTTATAPAKPAAPAPAKPATPAASAPSGAAAPIPYAPAAATASTKSTAPKAVSEVDVVKKMEELAAANPAKLDWKVSIVDLLKLLDIESSFEARKELATELGCPADLMGDSAKMNVWLHKTVLKKIAENGGNIPQALLD